MRNINYNLPTNELVEGGVVNEEFRKINENFTEVDTKLRVKQELVGVMNQVGLEPPILNSLYNNYLGTVSTVRVGVGDYTVILSEPLLILDKTVPLKEVAIKEDGSKIVMELVNTTTYSVKSYDDAGDLSDDIIVDQYFSFETYS